jgi:hypothetical protein
MGAEQRAERVVRRTPHRGFQAVLACGSVLCGIAGTVLLFLSVHLDTSAEFWALLAAVTLLADAIVLARAAGVPYHPGWGSLSIADAPTAGWAALARFGEVIGVGLGILLQEPRWCCRLCG